MSDKKDDNRNKKNENDPYDFFKFSGSSNNNNNKNPKNNKNGKKGFPLLGVLLIVLAGLAIVDLLFSPKEDKSLISYSEFMTKLDNFEIDYVEISDSGITGYGNVAFDSNNPKGKLKPAPVFKTHGVVSELFLTRLEEHKLKVQKRNEERAKVVEEFNKKAKNSENPDSFTLGTNTEVKKDNKYIMDSLGGAHFVPERFEYKFIPKTTNWLFQIFINILPFLIILFIYFLIMRKMSGGAGGVGSIFGAGQSRAKSVEEGKIKTRFADVAGVDDAKEELVEVVDFLKFPKKYTDIGGKIPKGVLLVGPPGTGKTLLARAVAGEAGVPFFSISGSDFVEMFVGVGASRVRDLFKQAREKAPCIVFIDEIDALGKSRVNGFGGGNDEREQTLNQLLVEMDGFENEKGLIILAATNRADILDPALLRPGRFDRQVPVEKPDVKGREDILRIHAKNVKLDNDVDFVSIAHGTTGFAGADLANVVNEAALLAVRNKRKKVTMEDFNDAIDKVSVGLKKKSRKDNKKEMRLVSVHETGHALVAAFTPEHEKVNKITVVPRSHGVGGFTQYRDAEEKNFLTKKDLIREIDSLMGGRAAEQIMLDDISTGASNDIARATDIVKRMIVDFGMSDKFQNMTLGKGVLGNRGGEPNLVREFSEDTQKYIDEEIARIVKERYEAVIKLLSDHKILLEYIARRLLEIETMTGKEFYEIVEKEADCKELLEKMDAAEKAKEEEKTAEKSEKEEKESDIKTEEISENAENELAGEENSESVESADSEIPADSE